MKNTAKSIDRYKIRGVLCAVLALTALFSLCSCTKPSEGDVGATNLPVLLPTAEPSPTPIYGGKLFMSIPVNADISDPLSVNTEEMLHFFSLITESLVALDETSMLTPELAENWSCDETGRVWTFSIRSGVKWHETGRELSADDIVYTIEKIASAEECYYKDCIESIEAYSAPDDRTLVLTMKKAGLGPLFLLTFPIVCRESDESRFAIGTGAYRVIAAGSDSVMLRANEHWWRQTPFIQSIECLYRESNEVALASYSAGQLNFVSTSTLHSGRFRAENETTVTDIMTQNAEVMLFSSKSSLMRDAAMRKAIAYSLNRSKVISNIYMNKARSSDVPIAPDSWLYDGKFKIYDYDRERALAMYDELGWKDIDGDGILEDKTNINREMKLSILVSYTTEAPTRNDAAEQFAAQLNAIGINTEMIRAEHRINSDDSEYMRLLGEGSYDIAFSGFCFGQNCDFTEYFAADGKNNYGGFASARLAALADEIGAQTDVALMREAAQSFMAQFLEELPFMVLYFRLDSVVHTSKLADVGTLREPDIFRNIQRWYMAEP